MTTGLQPSRGCPRTILYVANKRLPPSDYRIQFGRDNPDYRIIYALPERSDGLAPENFVSIGFREGVEASDLVHFAQLYRYLIQNRHIIELVHFYSTKLVLFGPLLAAAARVPSMITITGLGRAFDSDARHWIPVRRLYMWLLARAIRRSRRVLFQNQAQLREFVSRFPRESLRFEFIGSTVDMPVVARDSYESPRLNVLLVSRIMPTKGIEDFLRVAENLRNEHMTFVLVGPPSIGFKSLQQRVERCAAAGFVDYRGELGAAATRAAYESAHVFFFPSAGEGMARVMLECGFAGLCPVAYDIPANRDLIAPGRGYLVRTGDREGVVAILRELEANRALLHAQALAYQQFIADAYSMPRFMQRMNRIMLEALAPSMNSP